MDDTMDDEYVAELLTREARESSQRYQTTGSYMSRRPAGNAPKANTRFLRHLIKETDSHNTALKRKEEREARDRLRHLRARPQDDPSSEHSRSTRRDDHRSSSPGLARSHREERRDRQQRDEYTVVETHLRREIGHGVIATERTLETDPREITETESDVTETNGTTETSRVVQSATSLLGNIIHTVRRLVHAPVVDRLGGHGARDAIAATSTADQSPRQTSGRPIPGEPEQNTGLGIPNLKSLTFLVTPFPTRLELQPTLENSHESPRQPPRLTQTYDAIARIMIRILWKTSLSHDEGAGPIRSRGRGAYKPRASNIDAHFAPNYDPTEDLPSDDDRASSLDKPSRRPVAGLMTADDDWDMALEALRDRQRWKAKGEERLRAAGMNEETIDRWKNNAAFTGADSSEGNPEHVRWAKKGEGREWDRGKVIDEDGHVDVRAACDMSVEFGVRNGPASADERNDDGKSFKNPQHGVLSKAYEEFPDPLCKGRRGGFDIHIYHFQTNPDQVAYAKALWERIRREFPELRIYAFFDKPIGPHPVAMFEVNLFTPAQFGAFIPWLVINRGPLSALVHPNTVDEEEEERNHTQRATWLGERIPLDLRVFKLMKERQKREEEEREREKQVKEGRL
ncbi:hypothetical protein PoHVEF18_005069 [Penicillium ochrochloron]